MGKAARVEIDAQHVITGDIDVVIQRVTLAECSSQIVLEVGEAVEGASALGQRIIHTAEKVIFEERVGEGTGVLPEWIRHLYRNLRVLQGPFAVAKEEQLIFNHRPAQAGAVLAALEGR